MPLDKSKSNTTSKKEQLKRSKRLEEMARARKKNDESDDSDSSNYDTEEDEETEEMDIVEYHKLLADLFPSRHMDKKVKLGEKVKKIMSKIPESDDEDNEDYDSPQYWEKKRMGDRILAYMSKYRELNKKSTVEVYRVVVLKNIKDLNLKAVGIYWSFEKEGAGSYGLNRDRQ